MEKSRITTHHSLAPIPIYKYIKVVQFWYPVHLWENFEILYSSLGNVYGTLWSTSLYEDKFRNENEHISEICGQLFFLS